MKNIDAVHVVPALAPVSTTAAVQTDVIGLKEYHAVKFLIPVGALAVNLTITIEECDDTTPSNSTAIAFSYKKTSAVGTDTIGALTASASTGLLLTGTTDNNKVVEIQIDGSDLSAGYPYVRAVLTPASASACLVSAVAVLEPRYIQAVPPSAVD